MSEGVTRDELKAHLEAAEARAEARFERWASDVNVANAKFSAAVHADIEGIHTEIRALERTSATKLDLIIQTIAVVGLLVTIYFGVIASNQAAGSLGVDMGSLLERAAKAGAEQALAGREGEPPTPAPSAPPAKEGPR